LLGKRKHRRNPCSN